VAVALKAKVPAVQPAPKQAKGKVEAFENWELEKKYQTKLKALQQQIEEGRKETQDAEKQARHWQEMANRFEKEKHALQTRMVDMNAKPPRAAQEESLGLAQVEQLHAYKDKVHYLQEENAKLEKQIAVQLKAEIGRLQADNDRLKEKLH